jgi:hypothetical protein
MAISKDTSNLSSQNKKTQSTLSTTAKAQQSGIGNTFMVELIPKYNVSTSETLYLSNNSDASIVMGKDRLGSKLSGHGGFGDTKSATIDIVVGRISPINISQTDDGDDLLVDSNTQLDSARIYISQQTDVDDNFQLVDGKIGNSKNKSAIAMKADGIRIIGREGIKLVTKTDIINSANNKVESNLGIDIIALNDETSLQPMVLGNNLNECLREIIMEIDNLQNRISYFIKQQQLFNKQISEHRHFSPFNGLPTTPPYSLKIQLTSFNFKKFFKVDLGMYFQKYNFGGIISKYLTEGSADSIKSKYNNVN